MQVSLKAFPLKNKRLNFVKSFVLLFLMLFVTVPSSWGILDFKKGAVIRDSEIEHMLRTYIDPLFEAAGLVPGSEKIILIIDPEMNAAATLGEMLIINTGFLIHSKNVWDVIGVLAHETGHIAGRHFSQREESMKKILTPTLLTGLVGTAAAVLLGGGPEGGIATAASTMHVAQRSLLQYSRGQEASADQAALRYLDKLHWSSRGLLNTFESLSGQELLLSTNQDPYAQTHPLTQERLETMKRHVEASPYKDAPPPPHFEDMFNRVHIKLVAFLSPPAQILNLYPPKNQTLTAYYARAIAYLRLNQTDKALKEIDFLLKELPQDPFFLEMKGQILFLAGHIKEALIAYEKAVSLRPTDIPLKLSFAQTLLEDQASRSLEKAVSVLDEILTKDPEEAMAWRLKAIALGRQNKIGLAALALSEFSFRVGDTKQSKLQADRALNNLPKGSPSFLRAQDIKNSLELNSGPENKKRS